MSHRSPGPAVGGDPSEERRSDAPTLRPAWVVVALLLGVGIVVPLLVFAYDRETPTLIGFPFYYWFQFALIPVVSALTFLAFRISLRATEKDRAALGLSADERPQDRGPGQQSGEDV